MPATAGSAYQVLRTQHIAGIPPAADPQRSTETFEQYKTRMAAIDLPPDIDATESDADYLIRLATYAPPMPYEIISASYAVYAGTETGIQVTAQTASYVVGKNVSGAVTSSLSSSYILGKNVSGATTSSISASHALVADAAGGVMTNAQTASRVVGTFEAGTGVDIRSSTSGIAIYAEAMLSEAVLGTQKGVLTGDVNRGAIAAYRDVTDLNGFDTKVAVFTATDNDLTGSAPLISAYTIATEVFRVDKTGSLWSSGSKGYTGIVINTVTMSFVGGLFISASA